MDEVMEEVVLDHSEELGVHADAVPAEFYGGVDEVEGEDLSVLVAGLVRDHVRVHHVDDVEERAEEVEDVHCGADAIAGVDVVVLRVRLGILPVLHLDIRQPGEYDLDQLMHRVPGAPLQQIHAVGRLLNYLHAQSLFDKEC